jgi:hypothetical protein
MFNKSTRSYLFRALVAEADRKSKGPLVLTWTEARLMFKGATCAAIYRAQQSTTARSYGR